MRSVKSRAGCEVKGFVHKGVHAGPIANFLLLSLLNAFYSFDYKWSLSRRSLEERIHYFECHWAYFLGTVTFILIYLQLL